MSTIKIYHAENRETFNKFVDDTAGENVLQIVLRTHLYIENSLEKIIRVAFKNPNVLLTEKSMFSNKLSLVSALGAIPHEFISLLKYFNKIRNKFAHDLQFELTEDHLTQLVNRFDKKTKQIYDFFNEYIDTNMHRVTEDVSPFLAELRTIMSSLFSSINNYHVAYLLKPIEQEFAILNEFEDVLKKSKDEQEVYLNNKFNDVHTELERIKTSVK